METTTTTTPSATTEAAPAAPATSAPASTPTPSERPQTLQEAFARDATTAPPTDDSTEPAATAQTPAPEATTDPLSTEKQGPIPFAAHKTALENARTKAATEAVQQFERDYGWAKQVSPQEFQSFAETARQMSSDPIGFLQSFASGLQDHPVYGPQLRSQAARTLATRQASTPPEPDVAVTDETGRVIAHTYSDGALAKRDEWLIAKVVSQMQGEIAPLKQSHAEAEAQRAHAEATAQIESQADGILSDIKAIVGEDDAAIAAVAEAMDAHPDWSPHRAAAHVAQTVVRPKFEQSAESKVLESLKTKAAAATPNPAGAVVSATQRPTSLLDKGLQW